MGNITRTCQANGVWSGNPPTCICESNLLRQTPKLILAKFLIPPSYLKQVLLLYSLAIPFGKFSGHTVWQYLNRAIPFGVAVSGKGGLLLKWYFVSSFLINNFALWLDGHHFFPALFWYFCFHSTVVQCEFPNAPANGIPGITSNDPNSLTAIYRCNTGYNLVGNRTRTCQSGGVWSGSEPTCEGVLLLSTSKWRGRISIVWLKCFLLNGLRHHAALAALSALTVTHISYTMHIMY